MSPCSVKNIKTFRAVIDTCMSCRVPVRWGLQQTTRAPGSDKTRGQGSFGPFTGGQNLIIEFGRDRSTNSRGDVEQTDGQIQIIV